MNLPKDGELKDNYTPKYFLQDFMSYPPLGLLSIVSELDTRHEVEVLDTVVKKMKLDDVISFISSDPPELLGISVVTWRLFPAYYIVQQVKKLFPTVKIVLGGPHFNFHPKETMEWDGVDYILAGYADKTFPQLIEILDKKEYLKIKDISGLYYRENGYIKSNPLTSIPLDLDEYPFPKRSLINLNDYFTVADKVKMTTTYTSRGCPYKCTYCDVSEKKFHYRSAKKIVDEFELIVNMGIKEIHIFDDTFNVIRQRVIDMCTEIIKRGIEVKWNTRARVFPADREMLSLMKDAGCNRLHVGVESLDPLVLKKIKKNQNLEQIQNFFALCNEFKVDTLAYFMLGFPEETEQYRKSFYDKVLELKPTFLYLNILQPLANTEYYEDLLRKNIIKADYWKEFVKNPVRDFAPPPCRDQILQKELEDMVDSLHRKFYLSPKFIFKDILRNTSYKTLKRKANAGIKLLLTGLKK